MSANKITHWNRLEGSPFEANDSRSLEFRIRDPLWMLTRQWQLGEFEAEDNGSPIEVYCDYNLSKVRGLKDKNSKQYQAFNLDELPLEAEVENINEIDYSLQDAYQAGKLLLETIDNSSLGTTEKQKLKKGLLKPGNPYLISANTFIPDRKLSRYFKLLLRQPQIDGIKIFHKNPSLTKLANLAFSTVAIEKEWRTRMEKALPFLTKSKSYWKSDQLEYQFDIAVAEGSKKYSTYSAEEYDNGTIDWFNFKADKGLKTSLLTGDAAKAKSIRKNVIPVQLSFPGMPSPTLWEVENTNHNLLNLNPEKSELIKLVVSDFAMNYSNDWFDFPLTIENGNKVSVKAITIKDVFGDTININKAPSKVRLFNNDSENDSVLLLSTNTKKEHGPTIEEIVFVRDEIANLVFGIEEIVPNGLGEGLDFQKAKSNRKSLPTSIESDRIPNNYKIKSQFEENWIPFVAKQKSTKGDMILQRGSQLKYNEISDNYERVRPNSILLREGIDAEDKQKKAFFLNEEEVPKSGVIVKTNFQRTRWYNGKVVTWLGREKRNGKGSGGSNLRYDYLE